MEEAPGLGPRWHRMSARLAVALDRAGLGAVRGAILEAHDQAGAWRASRLPPDEEDPRWLHPGRNLLILLTDVGTGPEGVRDPALLALATGLDRGRPALEAPDVRREAAARGLPLFEGGYGAPSSGEADEAWLEAAVLLPDPELHVLLADALDHLRHLHLEPPSDERARVAARAELLLLPLAQRTGGVLERRFRWWCRRVARGLAAPGKMHSS